MPLIVCTDLDGTLLPNGPAPDSPGASERFRRLARRPDVWVAFVTGRNRRQVEDCMREYRLPEPDFVISDVGTTLYAVRAGVWTISTSWAEALRSEWPGAARDRLRESLADLGELEEQEPEHQGDFKLSYYTTLDREPDELLECVRASADRAGTDVKLVWSVEVDGSRGLLDVLPPRSSKLGAIEHLLREEEIDHRHVVYAGDSGNDLEVLTSPLPAVLVANASDDVRRLALRDAERRGTTDSLYFANGNYAAGVLEGIAHFRPEIGPWLESLR